MSENKIRSWDESFELYRTWILAGNDPISTNDEILNKWLSAQRLRRSGKKPRQTLTPERENKLTELGMVWDVRDHKYRQYILECEKYYKQFGNLDVPAKYISNGLKLGNWIQRRRKAYQNHREGLSGKGVLKITEAQIRELEALGMVWSSNRQSAKSFPEYALLRIAKRYFQDAKTLTRHNSPCKMELDIFIKSLGKGIEYDGVYWHKNKYKEDCIKTDTYQKNGIELIRIRESGLPKIPNCQNIVRKINNSDDDLYEAILKALQLLGVTDIERNAGNNFNELLSDYLKRNDDEWGDVLNEAIAVASRKGKQLVISKYHRSKKGFPLAAWLNTQRSMYRKGRLSTKRQKMLINAGFSLRPSDAIENENIKAIDEFIAEYGSIDAASDSEKKRKVRKYINRQREQYRKNPNEYDPALKRELESRGIDFCPHRAAEDELMHYLNRYEKEYGHINVPNGFEYEGYKLGQRVSDLRKRQPNLSRSLIDFLDSKNFSWSPFDDRWENGFNHAHTYKMANGDMNIPVKYICDDGYPLGSWISQQRRNYKKGTLSDQRANRLDKLGMIWDKYQRQSC